MYKNICALFWMDRVERRFFLLRWFGKNDNENNEEEQKLNWKQKIILDLRDVVTVLASFMMIYMLLFRVVVVVGPSMYDTLVDGDRLVLMSNVLYHNPKQGDIIVASKDSFRNGECIVKRVIATEGQRVDINFFSGTVTVDGEVLDESAYITGLTVRDEGMQFPLTVPENCVFVLGDNRGVSNDSRSPEIGQVDTREDSGKALFLLMPGTNHGKSHPEYGRIGVIK
jgi:signal peptidase I